MPEVRLVLGSGSIGKKRGEQLFRLLVLGRCAFQLMKVCGLPSAFATQEPILAAIELVEVFGCDTEAK